MTYDCYEGTERFVDCLGIRRDIGIEPHDVDVLSWSITDPEVAEVDEVSGRVRGLSGGSAGIRATERGISSASWGEVGAAVLP